MNIRDRNKRIARTTISCMLAVCLVAGSIVFLEPVSAGTFTTKSVFNGSTYTHAAKYSGDLIVNGVDVSYWQAKGSDWTKAKANGVDFAIMRVTYTSYGPTKLTMDIDSKFATHYANAKAAGVMRGAYVFSQAKSAAEAKSEAEYAIKRLKALGVSPSDLALPLYMDYEFAGSSSGSNKGRLYGLKKATATAAAKAFCDTVRAAGYQPGIYANTSFFNSYIDTSQLGSDVDLWCAQYYSKNTSTVNYSKWQYSSSAKISGILSTSTGKIGSTDVNFWYLDKKPASTFISDIFGVTEYNYTGKAVSPKFEIYSGGTLLKEGQDYTINGITNVNKGSNTACAYIKGIGSYSGYALVPFTIGSDYIKRLGLDAFKAEDGSLIIENASKYTDVTKHLVIFLDADGMEISSDYYEEGTPVSDIAVPAAPVMEEDEDYTYEFIGWIEQSGSALSAVNGPAIYSPQFEGTRKAAPVAEPAEESAAEQAEEPAAEPAEAEPAETAELAETVIVTPEPVNDPQHDLTFTESVMTGETSYDFAFGINSYGSFVRNIPEGLTVKEFLNGIAFREGTGEGYSFAVIDGKGGKMADSADLRTGMLLGVYDASGKLAGTADITVNGDGIFDNKANYVSTTVVKAPVKVTVPKTYIKKLYRYKKAFKVKVAKKTKSQVTGYQVRYSTKKNMSGAKIKNISTKYSTVTKKITGLKKKKRYYVQVRSYKTVNGKKYYSAWSAKKSVKTK